MCSLHSNTSQGTTRKFQASRLVRKLWCVRTAENSHGYFFILGQCWLKWILSLNVWGTWTVFHQSAPTWLLYYEDSKSTIHYIFTKCIILHTLVEPTKYPAQKRRWLSFHIFTDTKWTQTFNKSSVYKIFCFTLKRRMTDMECALLHPLYYACTFKTPVIKLHQKAISITSITIIILT